ncbi:MAG: DUF427 domain-containing protein [Candidatus Binatia bacterium]|nr:DUF427 domain-containing protein [Candidatus Binatia bacterium]
MTERHIENGRPTESVWDYPRPPRSEPSSLRIQVRFGDREIADSTLAHRVLETSHPPVFYIPPADVLTGCLHRVSRRSFCEWKGSAIYYDVVVGDRREEAAAWSYPTPTDRFELIRDYIAFYPSRMDECLVDGEIIQAQPGDFYGGWITSEIRGPFKGSLGTDGW